ncbi:YidB family protein [Methylomicrobium album]|uniref:LysM domain-containing protein n=1 Tax=Methylomicrobium album BG8 TaxID=686340 RepID=H8GG19_METAL|nr:YidB family protein [Methylomicrobium album]EIC29943.1 hypothetical protein Metal_2192 [Methylomicrobium album BG8]
MSLFTEIVKSAIGANTHEEAEPKTQNLVNGALGMLESMGGVGGLVQKFQQSGLGEVASSWVGKEKNQTVQPEQLKQVLGEDQIRNLAQRAGISESAAPSVLSKILPDMVDRLTPEGKEPESGNLAEWGKMILGGAGIAAAAAGVYFGRQDKEEDQPSIEPEQTTPSPAVTGIKADAPAAPASPAPQPRTYQVASGDTLSEIAKRFYHDPNQWPRIYEANRDILNNPDRISPGQNLRIP